MLAAECNLSVRDAYVCDVSVLCMYVCWSREEPSNGPAIFVGRVIIIVTCSK